MGFFKAVKPASRRSGKNTSSGDTGHTNTHSSNTSSGHTNT